MFATSGLQGTIRKMYGNIQNSLQRKLVYFVSGYKENKRKTDTSGMRDHARSQQKGMEPPVCPSVRSNEFAQNAKCTTSK